MCELSVNIIPNTIDTAASVFLRLKPTNKPSMSYSVEKNVLKVRPLENTATNNKDMKEKHFKFTEIFHSQTSQADIYNESVFSSIQNDESLTILTYGTSGSGKTYTMFGAEKDAGIVQRAIAHIFTVDDDVICNIPAAKVFVVLIVGLYQMFKLLNKLPIKRRMFYRLSKEI